ncbi:MATE family efflux transporter [Bariatricus sp. SGI.154]|uniref:MATE family efflux transporter n=1 Tax=Bariatricus sp. SGI.154 TaxID=3420549 RepID=UPI003D009585
MSRLVASKSIKNLTEGSPAKLLLLFSLPLMAGNIFQQLYTVVDTAVVGKVLGVETLAALGAVDWLNWMVLGIVQGFAQGFAILMAQRFGAEQYKRLRQVVANSIMLSLICAIVMTAVSQGAARPVLNLLNTPSEIQPVAIAYLRILFAGVPVVMAYNLGACVLRSMGDGKTPLYAMVLASLVNIGLDVLFVMGFGWGVQGAAIATIIAQFLSAVYCFLKIRQIEILHMTREDWQMERSLCGRLLILGAPMAFQNTIISVGGMIVQTVVNGFGVVFIAGFTATNKLYGLLETAATSYGYAMVTYAGQNLGANKKKRISDGIRAGILISLVTSVMITMLMLTLGRVFLGWFISADAASGKQALEIAFKYLKIMSICLPILYVLHVTRSCIQGLGNTVLPMVSGFAEFVMRTGSALLLPLLMGENGIFYAEILAWSGADLILIPSYFYVMNKIKNRNIPFH